VSDEHVVAAAVAAHRGERGPLLAILEDIVAELGYLPQTVVSAVAERLNLSPAEVHGVVSFYQDLRVVPPPGHLVQLCRGEACQAVGAERLVEQVAERLGGGAGPDGAVGVEQVFCLGNCALGPAGRLDGRLHGRLTADRVVAAVQGQS
jgi:formate dehydrogenase subunit gamma